MTNFIVYFFPQTAFFTGISCHLLTSNSDNSEEKKRNSITWQICYQLTFYKKLHKTSNSPFASYSPVSYLNLCLFTNEHREILQLQQSEGNRTEGHYFCYIYKVEQLGITHTKVKENEKKCIQLSWTIIS